VEILRPDWAVGAVGDTHIGDLRRTETQIRILELDQYRVSRQHLQQHEGEGEGRPQHQ
jgi:hypothetical protein